MEAANWNKRNPDYKSNKYGKEARLTPGYKDKTALAVMTEATRKRNVTIKHKEIKW